jgi:hypothetical protein
MVADAAFGITQKGLSPLLIDPPIGLDESLPIFSLSARDTTWEAVFEGKQPIGSMKWQARFVQ